MIEIKCGKCNAQLQASEEAEAIVCGFCGHEQKPQDDILCACGGKTNFWGKCRDCGKWG